MCFCRHTWALLMNFKVHVLSKLHLIYLYYLQNRTRDPWMPHPSALAETPLSPDSPQASDLGCVGYIGLVWGTKRLVFLSGTSIVLSLLPYSSPLGFNACIALSSPQCWTLSVHWKFPCFGPTFRLLSVGIRGSCSRMSRIHVTCGHALYLSSPKSLVGTFNSDSGFVNDQYLRQRGACSFKYWMSQRRRYSRV